MPFKNHLKLPAVKSFRSKRYKLNPGRIKGRFNTRKEINFDQRNQNVYWINDFQMAMEAIKNTIKTKEYKKEFGMLNPLVSTPYYDFITVNREHPSIQMKFTTQMQHELVMFSPPKTGMAQPKYTWDIFPIPIIGQCLLVNHFAGEVVPIEKTVCKSRTLKMGDLFREEVLIIPLSQKLFWKMIVPGIDLMENIIPKAQPPINSVYQFWLEWYASDGIFSQGLSQALVKKYLQALVDTAPEGRYEFYQKRDRTNPYRSFPRVSYY